jgi:hypothetical protein
MIQEMLALGWLLALAASCQAGQVILAWDMPLDWQPGMRYVLRISSTQAGRSVAAERTIDPFPAERCRQWPDAQHTTETLCGQVCLDPGDFSLSLHAVTPKGASGESNVLDLDLTSTSACMPVTVVHAPQAKPSKAATTAVGVAATVGIVAAGQGGGNVPSIPGLPNMGCVSWSIVAPCMCGPFTPCVVVTYMEPAFIAEVVKKPGDTVIPVLGDVLQAVLNTVGIPALGGGGSGNATGSGHTNLAYSEVHIYAFPNLLGGPCTSCAPNGGLALHYASEIDSATWRTAVAVPSPLDLIQQIGVWGPLYPRGGKVIHASGPIAAALVAVRGMSIAHQPIGTPPQVEAHIVTMPTIESGTCLQMAYPRQLPCMDPGGPPPLWETGTTSLTGKYVFVFWRRRTCCVNPANATCGIATPGVGGYGSNLCILPPLP